MHLTPGKLLPPKRTQGLLLVKYLVRGIDEGMTFRGAEVCAPQKAIRAPPLSYLCLRKLVQFLQNHTTNR